MPLHDVKDIEVVGGKTTTTFRVPAHLDFVKRLGSGAYGCVAAFRDESTGSQVAIKKVTSAFDDEIDGKRILREVKLLRQLKHDNILRIIDIIPPESPDFDDIYVVTDLMDCDLSKLINASKVAINDAQCRHIMYQFLRGLVYLHSAQVVHRDLKPANLLVNKHCEVKICDFGLARVLRAAEEEMTDYVVTRWYRAPELVLLPSEYTQAIDMWAAGCILYELVERQPLFPGKDCCDMVKKIVQVLGTPSDEEMDWLPADGPARDFVRRFEGDLRIDWGTWNLETVELIDALIRFHPASRLDAKEALHLEYFEELFVESDIEEDTRASPADFSFDDFEPTKELLQKYLYRECASFHPEIIERDRDLLVGPRAIVAL
jgi:mitogen-activated protein kinase 1/3